MSARSNYRESITITDALGALIAPAGIQVYVLERVGESFFIGSQAFIYSSHDPTDNVPLPQPITTDATGVINFWAEPGEYGIYVTDTAVPARIATQVFGWSSFSPEAATFQMEGTKAARLALTVGASKKIEWYETDTGYVYLWDGTGPWNFRYATRDVLLHVEGTKAERLAYSLGSQKVQWYENDTGDTYIYNGTGSWVHISSTARCIVNGGTEVAIDSGPNRRLTLGSISEQTSPSIFSLGSSAGGQHVTVSQGGLYRVTADMYARWPTSFPEWSINFSFLGLIGHLTVQEEWFGSNTFSSAVGRLSSGNGIGVDARQVADPGEFGFARVNKLSIERVGP